MDEKKRLESELRAAREALAVARHNEEESKNIALNYAKELEIKAVQAEEQAEDIKGKDAMAL